MKYNKFSFLVNLIVFFLYDATIHIRREIQCLRHTGFLKHIFDPFTRTSLLSPDVGKTAVSDSKSPVTPLLPRHRHIWQISVMVGRQLHNTAQRTTAQKHNCTTVQQCTAHNCKTAQNHDYNTAQYCICIVTRGGIY